MPVIRGCQFPDDLLYDIANHAWYRELPDGTVQVGMTAVAAAMAGQIVAFTPKRVGRAVEAGKSCATVESGKWVGPARIAFDGEVVAINEDLEARPGIANSDPYGKGWMVIARPTDWASVKPRLTPGTALAAAYEAKMAADGFAGCGP
ncbi:MAG: glycine cleavage system protein H [Alphaproteobacteria bacterium]|nr:glycine cleavage system protein H [Alphaproteobacteria bacterium]